MRVCSLLHLGPSPSETSTIVLNSVDNWKILFSEPMLHSQIFKMFQFRWAGCKEAQASQASANPKKSLFLRSPRPNAQLHMCIDSGIAKNERRQAKSTFLIQENWLSKNTIEEFFKRPKKIQISHLNIHD